MSVEDYVFSELLPGHRGHFGAKLAEAWQHADSSNKTKLESAFPQYFVGAVPAHLTPFKCTLAKALEAADRITLNGYEVMACYKVDDGRQHCDNEDDGVARFDREQEVEIINGEFTAHALSIEGDWGEDEPDLTMSFQLEVVRQLTKEDIQS